MLYATRARFVVSSILQIDDASLLSVHYPSLPRFLCSPLPSTMHLVTNAQYNRENL